MSVDLATLALKVEALEVDAASKKLDNLTAAGGRTERAAGGVTSAFKAVGSALAAVAFAQSIRQAVELADSYTRIEGRLKLVTSSATELASVQNALYAISQRSRAEYLATADVYNRFAQATKGQGIAQTELLGITETLNKAFAISGASTSEAAGAMVQLSQGFSSGVLRGDEFNTVMETGGRVVDLLADYLGVGRGELRGMAEDGKLTSDVLRNAIVSGASEVNAEFDKMPTTVGQAGTVLMNTLGQLVADANKASGATAGIADSIMGLAKTVDEHRGGILSFFSAMAGAGAQTFSGFEMGAEAAIGSLGELESKIGSRIPGITAKVTKLEAEIAKVNDSIALRTSRGASTDANKAYLAMLTYQLEQQKKLMKDLTSSPYITGEAAGKLNIVAEATQNVTFAMEGVKSQSESSMRITDEMRKKTLSYIETKEQSLKREKDAAMSGAKSTEERALVEKKYLDEIGKLHEKNGKSSDAAAKKAETAAKRQAEEYQRILDSLEPARVEQERYNEALAVLNKMDPTHETERYKDALEELNKTTKEGQELERQRAEVMGDLEGYERQVAQARMTDAERQIDDINRQTDALIKYGYELAKLDPQYKALAEEGAKSFGEKRIKDIQKITDQSSEMGKMFEDVAKNIQSAFAGMFEDMLDGSGNILDSLGDMFKKLLAQMATMAIANPIIVPIVTTIGTGMGMSTSSIASTLGMDTSQISGSSGMGGVSSLFSAGSSLFSSGSLQGMGVSSLGGISNFAYNIGFDSLGSLAADASDFLAYTSSGLAGGLVAGVGSLAVSLLSGEGLTAKTGLQAAGAVIGSIYGPVGSVVGGIIGGLVGGMFGTGEDTFGPQYMANDVGVNYSATTGMTPTTKQYTGGDTDSQIAKVYAEQMRSIQTAFDDQVTAMAEALPDEISSAMLDSLASANLKQILNDVSGQEINVKDAASWLERVATDYSEALVAELGKAYGTALSSFISTQGAEGLVGDSVAWSMLTEAVKQNITDSFQSAAATIAGGDIETGLSTINSVTNAIAAIESSMAPISEIIATNGLSDYELSLRSVNQQFDAYSAALQAAGVDMAKYTDLETARGIKLAEVQKAEDERLAALAEEAAQKAAALAEQRQNLEIQIMEAIGDSAGALSATRAIELAAMDESLRPLQERIYSLQDEATAAEAANEAAKKLINESITGLQTKIDDMITQYGDLTAAMAELDPVAATLVDSWRANKTELESLISGLAAAMGELPEQTALERLQSTLSALSSATNGISNLNDQIFALQTGTASSAAIGLLKAKEQELFASMATSLDPGGVASELAGVITKRITMQASLEEDAVNARYKAEYEAANTVAALEKQLRSDQISALQEQISAAKTLVDVVSSMPQFLAELRYSDLSSFNPGDQLSTAKGSFESIMAAAMSGDADAMQQLQSVGSSYLQEAQGYYGGATSQYAGVFADVTNALEQFGAQPVTDIDLLQSQVEYLQGIETATNTLNSTTIDTTDQQIDALIDVRDALTKREEQLAAQKAEDRQAVQAQIDQLKLVVTGQEAQIRQQAAMHAELMAQLAQANASLEALENTAALEAAAPA